MIAYIIKSVLCSALLIGAYYLFLEREKIHRFKRFYLITSLLFSLTIPLITIEFEQKAITKTIVQLEEYLPVIIPVSHEPSETVTISAIPEVSENLSFSWLSALLIVYGICTVVLLFRLCNNFLSILSDVKDKSIKQYLGATLVFHRKYTIPYSFLKYVFIREDDYTNRHILLHEMTHVRQKHTLDILLMEFIHCVMWFNPVLSFYKKAIRLNHEFLADEVVIKNFPTVDYQKILFQKTQPSSTLTLTSDLNYSGTKKRFIMMTTLKNKTRASVKMILAFATIVSSTILFTEKIYAQEDSIKIDFSNTEKQSVVHDTLTDAEKFDRIMSHIMRTQIDKKGRQSTAFYMTGICDSCKTVYLNMYNSLTKEQKAKYPPVVADIFKPIPRPKKQSPSAQEMADFSDPKIYGVWLDGKRINNSELAKYKATDIALVFKSRLMKNAAHYGRYKFHLDLMTHAYFDKTYPEKLN